jgi:predicted TIM-barrel fold metal-dependent hydrolase
MAQVENSERYVVISGDAHAGASVDEYRPYLPSRWHEEFDAWAVGAHSRWEVANSGRDETRNWDSARRDRDNDASGICAELLFPNTMPPFYPRGQLSSSLPVTFDQYERQFAGLQAHNRWTVDFCDASPGRRQGLVQIMLNDIDDALCEIRWGKDAGLGGILIPAVPPSHPTVEGLWSRRYDPIWALADELDMVVNQHIGAGLPTMFADAEMAAVSFEGKFYVRRALWHLIYGGVFDRFPRLRYVMTEEGLEWVVSTARDLEQHKDKISDERVVHGRVFGSAGKSLKLRPTEYIQRNCYICASGEFYYDEIANHRLLSSDHILWGGDYPHDEGTHPYTREALRAVLAGVPVENCRRILGLNAAKLYGFDLDVLRPLADRIGPTVKEIQKPLDRYPDGSVLELYMGKLPEPVSSVA